MAQPFAMLHNGKKISDKKQNFCARLREMFLKYNKCALITAENVNATQLLHIRHDLRGEAEIIFGKNSLMRIVVKELVESGECPKLKVLITAMEGQNKPVGDEEEGAKRKIKEGPLYNGVGLCFTNGPFGKIKEVIDNNCVGSPARVGAIAPEDVTIYPMKTTLPPTQVSVLHSLNIQSKIFKGTIEITGERKLITKGEKVGASEANLLSLLGIQPFKYTLTVVGLYDDGNLYGPEILDISNAVLESKFAQAFKNVAGVSVAVGYVNKASAPHLVGAAFKNIASIAVALDIKMKQIEEIQTLLSDPEALARMQAAQAAAPAGGEAKQEEAKEEEPEEELDIGGGLDDLFG